MPTIFTTVMDKEAWHAAVHRVAKSRTRLSDWTELNCGQESLRGNGVALIINNRVQNAVLGCSLEKWQNNLSSFPRQTIQHHSNSSLCPNHRCWRSWSWSVLWRPIRPYITKKLNYKTTTKKDVLFIIGDWNAKGESQEIPGLTGKFGLGVQNEAGKG